MIATQTEKQHHGGRTSRPPTADPYQGFAPQVPGAIGPRSVIQLVSGENVPVTAERVPQRMDPPDRCSPHDKLPNGAPLPQGEP